MAKKQFKEYLPGEQGFYADSAGDLVEEVPEDLESIRESLSMYPQAFQIVLETVRRLPYYSDNEKQDAFVAWQLAEILDSFGDRLHAVGTATVDDPYEHFSKVDLSAAKEFVGPEIDDEAVRQSALNQSDEEDDTTPTQKKDKEVAESAEVADDAAVRESLGVEHVDAVMEQITVDEVNELVESAGVNKPANEKDDQELEEEDEEDDHEDEYGGSESVQLGMLDSAGTEASPARCAAKATEILFSAIICGFSGEGEQRPGLAKRMRSLVEHGVKTRAEVNKLLSSVMKKAKSVLFKVSL